MATFRNNLSTRSMIAAENQLELPTKTDKKSALKISSTKNLKKPILSEIKENAGKSITQNQIKKNYQRR